MKPRLTIFMLLLCLLCPAMKAQKAAVKTNILYDAMTTPNLGVEVGVSGKNSINLVYGLNPWKFGHNDNGVRKAMHWVLMPEFRWWTCSTFNGHFFGVHLMGGQFNAANMNIPVPGAFFGGDNIRSAVRHNRYEGAFAGLGATYGYQWILSNHWNLEAEIGLGYDHIWYRKYRCGDCGSKLKSGHSNYAGVTKLGLSIMYIF